jgi:hypothetical protein
VPKVTGKKILQAVIDGGGMNSKMKAASRQEMEQFIEHELPSDLQPLLDEPATAKRIVEAQLAYNRCYLDKNMPYRLISAALPGDPRVSQAVAALSGKIKQVIAALETTVNDFDSLLRANGLQERDYLLSLNLPTGLTQKILNRQLTVGELIVTCPQVIMGFSVN